MHRPAIRTRHLLRLKHPVDEGIAIGHVRADKGEVTAGSRRENRITDLVEFTRLDNGNAVSSLRETGGNCIAAGTSTDDNIVVSLVDTNRACERAQGALDQSISDISAQRAELASMRG